MKHRPSLSAAFLLRSALAFALLAAPHLTSSLSAQETPLQNTQRLPLDVLVIAPHPDDEVIGCAGIILQALEQHRRVGVVVITSGDGYPAIAAAVGKKNKDELTPDDFLKAGALRQSHSVRAMARLGLPKEELTFLGYPDSGLEKIHTMNGSALFLQLFTRRSETYGVTVPDYHSIRHGKPAPYLKANVVGDIAEIIRERQPKEIYVTHEGDTHGDHRAAFWYVRDAVRTANFQGDFFTYVVHGAPPPQPPDRRLILSKTQMETKRAALIDHQQDTSPVHDRLADEYMKPEELFWRVSVAPAPAVQDVFRADKLAEMDAVIDDAINASQIVGAAAWVERNGVSHHKAFGHRTLKPGVEPMTEDTLFDVASVTKAVAAASAAMLCVERGLMRLDDPVSKHLPEFTGEGREKITIRHLLLHSSGLPVNLNSTLPPFGSHADALAQACRTKLLFEPGTAFSYSSAGTMVLGGMIERVTGRKFDEFCTTEIFKPLGMNDTVFRPAGDRLKRVAPTDFPERGKVNDTVARLVGGVAAHASLFTTTADLARFARMMLNLGELDGVRVFKSETVKLFTSVQSPSGLTSPDAKNLPVQRGLGWDIHTPYRTPPHDYSLARGALFPIGSYGHTGWTGQMLWIDPFSRTFVIFLCNRYGPEGKETQPAVYQLHHRISTLAAEAVKGFDFKNVPGALPNHTVLQATKEKPLINSLDMKFVPVPGTQILMCIHETRRADFAAYAALHPETDSSWKNVIFDGQPVGAQEDEPAVNVSWDAAQAFCQWLSQKEGRRYRLPTDREWSIALGIGDREPTTGATPESLSGKLKDEYPWGNAWPPVKGAGNFADEDCHRKCPSEKTMEGYADGFPTTSPVMSFPPNALGIYDLSGSVWEWCEDFMNATKTQHVLRGGSWGTSARNALLSSFRGGQLSTRIWRCDGFRCVLVVEP